jgi:hypothetical protein
LSFFKLKFEYFLTGGERANSKHQLDQTRFGAGESRDTTSGKNYLLIN